MNTSFEQILDPKCSLGGVANTKSLIQRTKAENLPFWYLDGIRITIKFRSSSKIFLYSRHIHGFGEFSHIENLFIYLERENYSRLIEKKIIKIGWKLRKLQQFEICKFVSQNVFILYFIFFLILMILGSNFCSKMVYGLSNFKATVLEDYWELEVCIETWIQVI